MRNVTDEILCTVVHAGESVLCDNITYVLPEATLSPSDGMFWAYLGIYCGLVITAGLMSGLTIGLLSLDIMSLKILRDGGTPKQRQQAERIMPIIERHHLLLVTLLLTNAASVESMPIFLDRISNPLTAIVVSVTAVLLFGEVFPQALCSRYGLAIGATLSPLVYFLMFVTFIISWPLAKLLDCMLGTEHSTFFRHAELKVLVDLHGTSAGTDGPLSGDEVMVIKGALEMRDKCVEDAMVKMEKVYMLDVNGKMDKETLLKLVDATHSRVPVYDKSRQNIRGILLVKTLISLDPDDEVPVSHLIESQLHNRPVAYVQDSVPLYDLLNEFQTGKCHLCMVYSSDEMHGSWRLDGDNLVKSVTYVKPKGIITGIITLEDVLEELLQEEILDETDVFVDMQRRVRVAQSRFKRRGSAAAPRRVGYQRSVSSRNLEESDTTSISMKDDPTTPLLKATTSYT